MPELTAITLAELVGDHIGRAVTIFGRLRELEAAGVLARLAESGATELRLWRRLAADGTEPRDKMDLAWFVEVPLMGGLGLIVWRRTGLTRFTSERARSSNELASLGTAPLLARLRADLLSDEHFWPLVQHALQAAAGARSSEAASTLASARHVLIYKAVPGSPPPSAD